MTELTIGQAMEAARAHHEAGRLAPAAEIYRQVLGQEPKHVDALHLLGLIYSNQGDIEGAVDLIRQAVELQPTFAEAQINLGNLLQQLWRLEEAVAAYRAVIAARPDSFEAYNNLGIALKGLRRNDEAIDAYRCALGIQPELVEAQNNLGTALRAEGRIDEAIESFRRAIEIKPHYSQALNNLGTALKDNGQIDEAVAAYRQALHVQPMDIAAHDNLLLALNYHPDYDSAMIFREAQAWNEKFGRPLEKFIRPHANDHDPERPLRIGYVSPDFRDHACGLFLMPLFRCHNRSEFELTCYAQVTGDEPGTAKMRDLAPRWRKTVGLSDERLAAMVREDKIDILVDLTLHGAQNRLRVFAQKPAPVQATWLGYPGTTGLTTMDYRLTDPQLDPSGTEAFYSEQSVRLPETFWCYDPLDAEPAVNELPCLRSGRVTFGSLNNFCKINDAVLSLWEKVFNATPGSRLLIFAPDGTARDRVRKAIGPDRVDFVAKQPLAEYRKTYHRIDIALDPFPCGGGTTSCDCLLAGVPFVTLAGRTPVGRAGASILTNAGLSEFIAHDADEYVQIATKLASDKPRLAALRATLRPRMQKSPLMDAPRFARNIEAAYRRMWRLWCQK